MHKVHNVGEGGSAICGVLAGAEQHQRGGQLGEGDGRHGQDVQGRSAGQAPRHQAPVLWYHHPLLMPRDG